MNIPGKENVIHLQPEKKAYSKMKRPRIIFLIYGSLVAKSVNYDFTDEENEELKQSRSVILQIMLCTHFTISTIALLFS